MTLATGALLVLLAVVALVILGSSPRPAPRRIRVDDDRRTSPTRESFEIHVTDYRGDLDDGSSPLPLGRALGLAAVVAAAAVAILAHADL